MRRLNAEQEHGRWLLAAAAICICFLIPGTCSAAAEQGRPAATVEALEGAAELYPDKEQEPQELETKELRKGDTVGLWDTVSAGGKSKVMLFWPNGVLTSLGEFSSLMLAPEETERGPLGVFQVVEGVIRFTGEPGKLDPSLPYVVSTPLVRIEPDTPTEPADFVVESYQPDKTVVTVISGKVRLKSTKGDRWKEILLESCQTAYIEESKDSADVAPSSPDILLKLVSDTTIAGTLNVNTDTCPTRVAEAPPPAFPPDYSPPQPEVEVWEVEEEYPETEIQVVHHYNDYLVVYIPGCGYWNVPIVAGVPYDPDLYGSYAGWVVVQQSLYYDRYWMRDYRHRRRDLFNAIYLAQRSGRTDLLTNLRGELDFLNTRANWTARRINRLERRVSGLEQQQGRFADRIPRGVNLARTLNDSFNSKQNVNLAQNFNNRLRNQSGMQDRLAGVGGQEVARLRARATAERDPQRRLAMVDQMNRLRTDLGQGKAVIPKKDREVNDLVRKMKAERDPDRQIKVQQQLLGELRRKEGTRPPDAVMKTDLTALKQDIMKTGDPRTRQVLENRFTNLQQSVEGRKREVEAQHKYEQLSTQAATETDPRKREQIAGQLSDLAKVAPLAVAPAALGLMQQRRSAERQLIQEKDPTKRATLQENLEDLKKRNEELTRAHLQEAVKPPEQRRTEEQEREKQLETVRKAHEEQKRQVQPRQVEQPLREQPGADRQADTLRKQQEEQRRGAEPRLREQQGKQDRERQADTLRKQQEEQRRGAEPRLREQQGKQDRERQADTLRKQQEEQRRGAEPGLREQRDKERQADTLRRQQEEQRRGAEPRLREQQGKQDRERQADTLRKQQEEQRRGADPRLREQQEKQERERQADTLRKQQEEQRRGEQTQQDRARQDQTGQQQERARKEQMHQQQQGAQQEAARQQQQKAQQDAARQQQQQRGQQEAARQQQQKAQQDAARQQQQQRGQQEAARQQQAAQQHAAQEAAKRQEEERKRQEQLKQQAGPHKK